MVQLPLRIEGEIVKSIDRIVRLDGRFRSRSDFIRKKLYESVEEENMRIINETALEIKEKLIKMGVTPKLLTRKDKIKIADEFLKENGLA